MAQAPAAPVIASISGSIETRLQQLADAITQNRVVISVLQQNVTALGQRQNNAVYAAPANPGAVTSAVNQMMGFALPVTLGPYTTRAQLFATADLSNTANNGVSFASLWYGTGTPPAFGAAVPGTAVQVAVEVRFDASSNQTSIPITIVGVATGLTPGGSYWIDMAVRANPGTANLTQVEITGIGLLDQMTF
jgi:hypothetical protein